MDDERGSQHWIGNWRRKLARVQAGEATTAEVFKLLGAFAALALGAWLVLVPVLALLSQVREAMLDPDAIGAGGTPLRDAALILAAVLGAPFVIWRTITAHWQGLAAQRQAETADRNRELTEQRNLTDRFVKAVEMLGAGSPDAPILEQRLGGIYALEQLARESRTHHIQIMEVLCAYIRQNAPASKARTFPGTVLDRLRAANPEITTEDIEADDDFKAAIADCPFDLTRLESQRLGCLHKWAERLSPPEDIRAALDVIGRRGEPQRGWEENADYRLDLRSTTLQGVAPEGRHFAKAQLDGAHLEGANLGDAQLQRTQLWEAHLEGAYLMGAQLEEAKLDDACLEGASMDGVGLRRASLIRAKLQGARLYVANLQGARLGFSDLTGQSTRRTILNYADFRGVTMEGAALRGLDLSDLQGQPSLVNAFGDASVSLPESLERPVHWPASVLDDSEFYARWRGWIEAGPQAHMWRQIVPAGFEDITPIPPDPGQGWYGKAKRTASA